MHQFKLFALGLLCCIAPSFLLLAQTKPQIVFQTPQGLSVCGSTLMGLTVTHSETLSGAILRLELAQGLQYAAGTITGAGEFNISDPQNPQFLLPDIPADSAATIAWRVEASCQAQAQINSGQKFSHRLKLEWSGQSAWYESPLYNVETALVLFGEISPQIASGQYGYEYFREIRLRNTRLGGLSGFYFSAVSTPGIETALVGAFAVAPLAGGYEAFIPGSYFKAFGNGDTLFGFNEEIVLTERVRITGCGLPPQTASTKFRFWTSCGGVCLENEGTAYTAIETFPKNAKLKLTPVFAPNNELCGQVAAVQELVIVNEGDALAQNAAVFLQTSDPGLAINRQNIILNAAGIPSALDPFAVIAPDSWNCDPISGSLMSEGFLSLPPLAPQDTLRLRFETYVCQELCDGGASVGSVVSNIRYQNECPGQVGFDAAFFKPDSSKVAFEAVWKMNVDGCLADGGYYDTELSVRSKRLSEESGFLHVDLRLPWGVFFPDSCAQFSGAAPFVFEQKAVQGQYTDVRIVVALPIASDAFKASFCLLSICQDTAFYGLDNDFALSDSIKLVFTPEPEGCLSCYQTVSMRALISDSVDVGADFCGPSVCSDYELMLDCGCDSYRRGKCQCSGGKDRGGTFGIAGMEVFRLNRGWADDDNDRMADGSGPADHPLMRLDRYLYSDTMRVRITGRIQSILTQLMTFNLLNEVWESEMDTNDGDPFDVGDAWDEFSTRKSVRFLRSQLTHIPEVGPSASFALDGFKPETLDQIEVLFNAPNISPIKKLDRISVIRHLFFISPDTLVKYGGASPDLQFEVGDTLVFEIDFRFAYNFLPLSRGRQPSLINFITSTCSDIDIFAWRDPSCPQQVLQQYSGYTESLGGLSVALQPCDTSITDKPFDYSIQIARGNMFPYEVRPLTQLGDFSVKMPGGMAPLIARLRRLQLQGAPPTLADQGLPGALEADGFWRGSFAPLFDKPLDEGYWLETQFRFAPRCEFESPQPSNGSLCVDYIPAEFQSPDPECKDYFDSGAFVAAIPNLQILASGAPLYSAGDVVFLDFGLQNQSPFGASNVWLRLEPDNVAEQVQFIESGSGVALGATGGFAQVGTLPGGAIRSYQLRFKPRDCGSFSFRISFGFDCEPVLSALSEPCSRNAREFSVVLAPPELELAILAQTPLTPACAPSDYIEFEVFNANYGRAFGVVASAGLPEGFAIVPGSGQLSYPAGAPYVSIPDPELKDGVYSWNLASLSAPLAQNGLGAIGEAPANAARIRFRVQTSCGAVSNAQPVFTARSELPCGLSANSLLKVGDPLLIEGLNPSYAAELSLQASGAGTACGSELTLSAQVSIEGLSGVGDSLWIVLPPALSYVPGSYQPGLGAPAGPPVLKADKLLIGVPAGAASFGFAIRVAADPAGNCSDQLIRMQLRERANIPCAGQICDFYILTGEALLPLPFAPPQLRVAGFDFSTDASGQTLVSVQIKNDGPGPAQDPTVWFYVDLNGNGKADPGEPLAGQGSANGVMGAGSEARVSATLSVAVADLCRLIAVLPAASNCACEDLSFALFASPVLETNLSFCQPGPVVLPLELQPGADYQWLNTTGLSCADCSNPVYTPPADLAPNTVLTLHLFETWGACAVERRFSLRFGADIRILTPDTVICQGQSLLLEATPGAQVYQWSGPGLQNPSLPAQWVTPTQSAVFTLKITLSDDCERLDTLKVQVLARSSTALPDRFTCPGKPVTVAGATLTDLPGLYSNTFVNAAGCDSLVTQRLRWAQPKGESSLRVCKGDTIQLFDLQLWRDTSVCRYFVSPDGCDSLHCIAVRFNPRPTAPDSIELRIAEGQSISLSGPPGFTQYVWTPSASLSCAACPAPLASPAMDTEYLLRATDSSNCVVQTRYKLRVLPPCDPERLLIPNVFTPDGDGLNDGFGLLPFEGFEEALRMEIYNRWGAKVYSGEGPAARWNGVINGQPAPSDVYVWILSVLCQGEQVLRKGEVTVLR